MSDLWLWSKKLPKQLVQPGKKIPLLSGNQGGGVSVWHGGDSLINEGSFLSCSLKTRSLRSLQLVRWHFESLYQTCCSNNVALLVSNFSLPVFFFVKGILEILCKKISHRKKLPCKYMYREEGSPESYEYLSVYFHNIAAVAITLIMPHLSEC